MTIEQLAVKVLSRLRVYDPPLGAQGLLNVSDAYNGVWHALNDDGLTTWAITDTDIPDRFQLPLTALIAAAIADFYNVAPPAEGWERTKLIATNTIRRQLATGQDPEPVSAEYY